MGFIGISLLLFTLAIFTPVACFATELVSNTGEFLITRDFSAITIPPPEIPAVRVFFDKDRLTLKGFSPAQDEELRNTAVDLLRRKLTVVQDKASANYLVQIRMEEFVNYAVRSARREPARGFVMSSICKFPIRDVATDCENLTYYYFHNHEQLALFRRLFSMWLGTVIPSSSR
jgi:hypothetical protein